MNYNKIKIDQVSICLQFTMHSMQYSYANSISNTKMLNFLHSTITILKHMQPVPLQIPDNTAHYWKKNSMSLHNT